MSTTCAMVALVAGVGVVRPWVTWVMVLVPA